VLLVIFYITVFSLSSWERLVIFWSTYSKWTRWPT